MTRITLQVLQNYTRERNPCIIIQQGKSKYLFNMGEPFLRFFAQHNIKLLSNMNIFFTRNTFDHMNGIQNLITSLYGSEASYGTKIYGPRDLVTIFNKFRCPYTRFVSYSFYDLIANEKIIGINDINITRQLKQEQPSQFNQAYYCNTWNQFVENNVKQNNKQKSKHSIINDPSSNIDKINNRFLGDENLTIDYISFCDGNSISYQINLPPIKGKLDKEKLDSYNIPKNLMKNFMQTGVIVLEGTGETLRLEDLKIEDKKGNSCLLFDCSSLEQLEEAIVNQKILYKSSETNTMVMVLHMVSKEIAKSERYQDFLKKFEDNVQHIFLCPGLNENIPDNIFEIINTPLKHQKTVQKLHEDFPDIFLNISTIQDQFIKQSDQEQNNNKNNLINTVFPGYKYLTLAKKNFEFILSGNTNEYIPLDFVVTNSLNSIETYNKNYLTLVDEFKTNMQKNITKTEDIQVSQESDQFDPEIILLGTTCALPSKYRNNSSILIKNQQNNTSVMLDAGDGTYFQLLSILGEDKIGDELLRIKMIFISHFHADHHMGFQEVLWRRQEIQRQRGIKYEDDPIYLILPWDMATWVDALRAMKGNLQFNELYIQSYNNEDFTQYNERGFKNLEYDCQKYYYNTYEEDKAKIRNKNILEILQTNKERLNQNIEEFNQKLKSIGYSSVKMIPVIHCQQAYAFVLESNDSQKTKISYTGDTRPCKRFIEAAKNSALLIHESTYEHGEVDLAEKALHSTVTEAIDVALQSNSKNILLTHISKRHKLLKIHLDGQSNQFIEYAQNNTAMAYDFLKFKISQFQKIVPITKIVGYIYKK